MLNSAAERSQPHALQQWAHANQLRPYESLDTTAPRSLSALKHAIEEQLAHGYTRDGFNIPPVYPPADWFAHNRSFTVHLHSWNCITDLLTGYSTFGDQRCLDAAMAHARGWIAAFQLPRLGQDSPSELDALTLPVTPIAWHHMAVGQRLYRLAYLLDVLVRQDDADWAEVETWWEAMLFHIRLLNRAHFFRSHTNHGLYQALGHLAAARRFLDMPGMKVEVELARQRIDYVLARHFSNEGPHKEHSPGYHYMLLGTLMSARRCGLFDSPELAARMGRIEAALPWMVKPNFCLATFGDTNPVEIVSDEEIANLYQDEQLRFAISGGRVGKPPETAVQPFHDAGYAFARLYSPEVQREPENATYLAQMAGFHSRVHKHADFLSFVWYERNRDILIDPGRYAYAGMTEPGTPLFEEGFWYADPKRIYCESTRAHNCVEIDERNYQRTKVKPFGSALVSATLQGELAVFDCAVTHFKTIRHRRHLIMRPGHFLLVLDWLYDRSGQPHDYRQYFHFDAAWNASKDGALVRAHHAGCGGASALSVTAASLVPEKTLSPIVRGQEEPELLGWLSDKPYSLIPASCFSVGARSSEPVVFATLFTLSDRLEIDYKATRFNATMKNGQACWDDSKGSNRVSVERKDNDLRVGHVLA